MKKVIFCFSLLSGLTLAQSAHSYVKTGLADRQLGPNGVTVFCWALQNVCALSTNPNPPKSGDLVLFNFGGGRWEVIEVKSAHYENDEPEFEQGAVRPATSAEIEQGEAARAALGF